MANRLLSASGAGRASAPADKGAPVYRAMLYHPELGSQIFEGHSAVEDALANGWRDVPYPVPQEPEPPVAIEYVPDGGRLRELNELAEKLEGENLKLRAEIEGLEKRNKALLDSIARPKPPPLTPPPRRKVQRKKDD